MIRSKWLYLSLGCCLSHIASERSMPGRDNSSQYRGTHKFAFEIQDDTLTLCPVGDQELVQCYRLFRTNGNQKCQGQIFLIAAIYRTFSYSFCCSEELPPPLPLFLLLDHLHMEVAPPVWGTPDGGHAYRVHEVTPCDALRPVNHHGSVVEPWGGHLVLKCRLQIGGGGDQSHCIWDQDDKRGEVFDGG